MSLLIDLWVPGEPVPKGRPRFDTRSGRTYTPERTARAEDALGWLMKISRKASEPCEGPVRLEVFFVLGGKRKPTDADNLAKLVMDSGNKIIWVDDSQIVRLVVDVVSAGLGTIYPKPGTKIAAWEMP